MKNDLFDSMVNEATEEVGSAGWREASQNAVTLAAFGLMYHKLAHKIEKLTKPAYLVGISVTASAIWYIISGILNS